MHSVVWDIGSLFVRAGYGGEERPKAIFPSVGTTQQVGTIDLPPSDMQVDPPGLILGEGLLQRRDHMRMDPIFAADGRSPYAEPNWDYLEQTIGHVFNTSLALNAPGYHCLFADCNVPSKAHRSKLAEIMFEKFQRYATGRSTCIVLDSGAWNSYAVPIWDGWTVSSAVLRKDLGGEMITQDLMQFLTVEQQTTIRPTYTIFKHPKMNTEGPPEFTIEYTEFPNTHPTFHQMSLLSSMRSIKETCFEVSTEGFAEEDYANKPTSAYIMPDGSTLDVGNERFRMQEMLFTGDKRLGETSEGLGHLLAQSIDKCEPHMRKKLLENVVVAGGNTLFPHFTDRLYYELLDLQPKGSKVRVVSHHDHERRYVSWVGGSILSSLQAFQTCWITRKEHTERGAAAIDSKCPL